MGPSWDHDNEDSAVGIVLSEANLAPAGLACSIESIEIPGDTPKKKLVRITIIIKKQKEFSYL